MKTSQPFIKNDSHSLLSALALLPCLYLPAHAADNGSELDTVVVTGTRSERAAEDAPVRTEVVSREEIERTHARTLKEALEDVPGLQLREIHGKAGYEASLQGLSGEQVLVLIDGLPISATTGSTVDLSQLALADVERIEIVKGAMSAQYGSSAMGGVINVITRPIEPGFHGRAIVDAGSYGEQNPSGDSSELSNRHAQLRLEGGNETWRLRLAGDIRDSDGIDPDPDSWPVPGDAVERKQFNLRGEWHPDASKRLFAEVSQFDETAESRFQEKFPGRTYNDSKNEEAERLRLSAGGYWLLANGLRLELNALDEQLDDDTIKYRSGSAFDKRQAELGLTHLTGLVSLPAWGRHLIQFGSDYHAESLGQRLEGNSELQVPGKVTRDSREVFMHDDIFLSDTWELLLGLRYQDDSDFGGHHAPKANLRGHLLQNGDWTGTLRLGWGEGYRVPNLKERYYLFDHSSLGYVVAGNPDLTPETSSSWQLGWRMAWRGSTWLDINLFHNRLQDLIQTNAGSTAVFDGDTVTRYGYENISRASTGGMELAANWQAMPTLRLFAGYTWMRTRDENTGDELTHRPTHQGRLGFDWQFLPRWRYTARTRYQSSELVNTASGARSPAWSVMDVAISYDWSAQLRLFAGIDNLTHEQRDFTNANEDFGPIAGRFGYAGLQYSW